MNLSAPSADWFASFKRLYTQKIIKLTSKIGLADQEAVEHFLNNHHKVTEKVLCGRASFQH